MKARTPTSTLKPPLTMRGHGADDGRLLGEGALQRGPVLRPRDLEARQFVVAFGIAALDGDRNLVARLYGFAGALEDGQRQNAFGLVADVEQDRIGGDGDDGAFQLPAAIVRLAREWLRSNCESRSPNDSSGSLSDWDSGTLGSGMKALQPRKRKVPSRITFADDGSPILHTWRRVRGEGRGLADVPQRVTM